MTNRILLWPRIVLVTLLALGSLYFFYVFKFNAYYQGWMPVVMSSLTLSWALLGLWVAYPLLLFPRGRFVLLLASMVWGLMLMPGMFKIALINWVQYDSGLVLDFVKRTSHPYAFLSYSGHLVIYFGFSLLTFLLFRQYWLTVFAVLLLMATLSELLQHLAIARGFHTQDLILNIMGVTLAAGLVAAFNFMHWLWVGE